MHTVILFGSVLLVHLGLSGFLIRCFLHRTSHDSAVPSPEAYARSHQFAERAQAEGLPLTNRHFLALDSTTYQTWSARPWTLLFAVGGLAVWLGAVVVRLSFAPPWLP